MTPICLCSPGVSDNWQSMVEQPRAPASGPRREDGCRLTEREKAPSGSSPDPRVPRLEVKWPGSRSCDLQRCWWWCGGKF